MIDTKELRRVAEVATPGPWVQRGRADPTMVLESRNGYRVADCLYGEHPCTSPDAEFIAAANPATVLALLDRVERLEKSITAHKEAMDHHGGDIDFSLWSALEDFSWK